MRTRRIDEQERMDDTTVPYADIEPALDELGQINRWLGGYRTTRIGVKRLTSDLPDDVAVTVLDVAAGGTDLEAVLRPLHRRFHVTALDVNPLMGEYAKRHRHVADTVVGSAHDITYPDRSFDIVHVSLFLHHCTDEQAIAVLQRAFRIARLGVVINELQRQVFALSGITLLTALFSHSPIVRNDARVSVRRGFTRRELESLFARGRIGKAMVSWQWAFRWCISIRSNGHG